MSGLFRGIGKVFKKVAKVVKKIALPAVLIGGVMLATGGMGMPALAGVGAAGGAVGAVQTATSNIIAGAGLGGGGIGGIGAALSQTGGAGFWGSLRSIFSGINSSPLAGEIIKGAAGAYGEYQTAKMTQQQEIEAEQREEASYEGTGAAMSGAPVSRGLGGALAGSSQRSAPAATGITPRPGAQTRSQQVAPPIFEYKPEMRRIVVNR